MTLTPDNMRIDKTGNVISSAAFHEDISRMDEGQLERYVRLAFREERDTNFLPPPFWDYTFGQVGGEFEPGKYFAGIYVTVPHAVAGTFTKHDGTKADIDPAYRNRFERVLEKIFDELLSFDGPPSEEQLCMAQYAIDAVAVIRFQDGSKSPERQFAEKLKQRGQVNAIEGLQMIRSIPLPDVESNELFKKAAQMKRDPKYAGLKYTFI